MAVTTKRLQRAMAEAVLLCAADGITDPVAVLARKMQARKDFLKTEEDQLRIDKMEADDAKRSRG